MKADINPTKASIELGLGEGDQVYCLIKSVSIDDRLMAAP
jgi:hypothetical protein